MLSSQELELLTAHVDGELSAAQRRQVEGLLESSGEARELVRALQGDAARLRALPRRVVPVDLSAGVLEEIGRLARPSNSRAAGQTKAPRVIRFPAWRGVAAAAAVLLAVGVTSFLINRPADAPSNSGEGRVSLPPEKAKPDSPAPEKGPSGQPHRSREEGTAVAKAPEVEGKSKAAPEKSPPDKGAAPPATGAILAANGGEASPRLERVELDLPTVARLHDLDKAEAATALRERLTKLRTARVELTTKDGPRAFERLRAVLLARKVNLHIDPATVARLKKTLVKSDVLVFVENVKAEEVVEWLREAGVADRQGEPRFDGAVVVRELGRWDRKDLTDLLGLDPLVTRPSPRGKAGLDIRHEIPEQTAREVAAALDGQGVPRPGAESAHNAYVSHLPASKSRPPELKRFLDLRQPPRDGSVQVLLVVLRQVG